MLPFGNARTCGQIASNFLTQASWRLYEFRQPSICLCTTSTAPNCHRSRPSLFHGRRRAGLVEQLSALQPPRLKLMQEKWSPEEQGSRCLSTFDIWLLLLWKALQCRTSSLLRSADNVRQMEFRHIHSKNGGTPP